MRLISLSIFLFLQTTNAQWRWSSLANMSHEIQFPIYTPQQRTLVAKQASLLFEVLVYTNLYHSYYQSLLLFFLFDPYSALFTSHILTLTHTTKTL